MSRDGAATDATFETTTAWIGAEPLPATAPTVIRDAGAFAAAIATAAAGDYIRVAAGVRIPGEFTGFQRMVGGGTATVVFEPGAGFSGGGGANTPAVWVRNCGGWRILGGTITNPDGGGILVHTMAGPFEWTGFTVRATAGTCVGVYPTAGDIVGLTLKGVAGTLTPNFAYDPHAEKGTGLHAWNIADGPSGVVRSSVFACDVLDQACGAGVQIEQDRCREVAVYARAVNLGRPVAGTDWRGYAQRQVAGNAVQLWDNGGAGTLAVRGVWGDTIMGRIVETAGASGSLAGVVVECGRALGPTCMAYGRSGSSLASSVAYAAKNGLVLEDCPQPA